MILMATLGLTTMVIAISGNRAVAKVTDDFQNRVTFDFVIPERMLGDRTQIRQYANWLAQGAFERLWQETRKNIQNQQ
jgi:hypothetical protein